MDHTVSMNAVAQIFAVVAGLVHVLIFAMESLMFRQRKVHGRFATAAGDVEAVRPWAYNQGWYNLFLAAGAIGGVIAVHVGEPVAGRAVALFCCAFMLAASLVLVGSNRKMLRGALIQGLAPLVALIAVAF